MRISHLLASARAADVLSGTRAKSLSTFTADANSRLISANRRTIVETPHTPPTLSSPTFSSHSLCSPQHNSSASLKPLHYTDPTRPTAALRPPTATRFAPMDRTPPQSILISSLADCTTAPPAFICSRLRPWNQWHQDSRHALEAKSQALTGNL